MARFTFKFYLGIFIIIISLIIGKLTTFAFLFYFRYSWIRWGSVIVYALSWPLMFWGIWWVGKEYFLTMRKYATYGYYHNQLKEGTRRAVHRTREMHERVKGKLKRK